jgi:hypothetical protein
MLGTLVLSATLALAPAQTPSLAITNDRITFGGEFGPVRPSNKLLPGDVFFLAFDIENLKIDGQGRANFTMGMNVTDASGKSVYEQKPTKQETVLPLGGNKLPARGFMATHIDMPAGLYNCRITLTDLANNESRTLDKPFEVLPKAFGLVGMFISGDDKGEVPAPFMGVAGQALWMHFIAVAFERSPQTKQPHLEVTMRAYDSEGKPTLEQPRVMVVNSEIPEKEPAIPLMLPLPMNRVGTFTIEIRAEDKVSGRTSRMAFPVTVLASPK